MRSSGALLGILLVAGAACGGARAGSSNSGLAGCAEALAARGQALDAIDRAEKAAQQKSPSRAAQLAGIASDGKGAVAAVADLTSCGGSGAARGVVVDSADLRRRYGVVVERATSQLAQVAAQPAVVPVRGGRQKASRDGPSGSDEDETEG